MGERIQGNMKRIVVGISGASGVIYGIRLLKVLKELDWETHLIISEAAKKNILLETSFTVKDVEDIAHKVYDPKNQAASISSGSYKTSA
jgi:4-hydroxy-3-polyprenylbenzoate decarboxylase